MLFQLSVQQLLPDLFLLVLIEHGLPGTQDKTKKGRDSALLIGSEQKVQRHHVVNDRL